MTCNTIIAGETATVTCLTIAYALIRTLHPGMKIIIVDNFPDPGKIFWACALRAVRSCPFRFTVEASEAVAVHVFLTSSVM